MRPNLLSLLLVSIMLAFGQCAVAHQTTTLREQIKDADLIVVGRIEELDKNLYPVQQPDVARVYLTQKIGLGPSISVIVSRVIKGKALVKDRLTVRTEYPLRFQDLTNSEATYLPEPPWTMGGPVKTGIFLLTPRVGNTFSILKNYYPILPAILESKINSANSDVESKVTDELLAVLSAPHNKHQEIFALECLVADPTSPSGVKDSKQDVSWVLYSRAYSALAELSPSKITMHLRNIASSPNVEMQARLFALAKLTHSGDWEILPGLKFELVKPSADSVNAVKLVARDIKLPQPGGSFSPARTVAILSELSRSSEPDMRKKSAQLLNQIKHQNHCSWR